MIMVCKGSKGSADNQILSPSISNKCIASTGKSPHVGHSVDRDLDIVIVGPPLFVCTIHPHGLSEESWKDELDSFGV